MSDRYLEQQPSSRFEELLELACEEIASESDFSELQAILRDDEAALRAYVNRLRLCAELYSVAEEGTLYNQCLDKASSAADIHALEAVHQSQVKGPGRRWSLLAYQKSLLFAASIAAVLFLVGAIFSWRADNSAHSQYVGKWTNGTNAEWAQNSLVFVGDPLSAGVYQLRTGIAELTLNSGAVLTVEGPARFEFLSADHCSVEFGQLVTRLPATSSAFQLTGPQTSLMYPGAEAAIRVSRSGHADLYVYDGQVRLASTTHGQSKPVVLSKDGSISIDPDGSTEHLSPKDVRSNEFVRRLGPVIEVDPVDVTSALAEDFNGNRPMLADGTAEVAKRFQLEERGGELCGLIPHGVFDPQLDIKLPCKAISPVEFPFCRYRLRCESAEDVRIVELFYYSDPSDRPIKPGDRRCISVKHYPEGPSSPSVEFRGPLPVVDVPPIKFLRLDPIHQTSKSSKCRFAYDYVYFDRCETLGLAEFDCVGDLQSWWGLRTSDLKVIDGVLRGNVVADDAQLITGSVLFNADKFTHFEVRLRRVPSKAQSLRRIQLYWGKPGDVFSPEKKAVAELIDDSEFHVYRIDLRRANGWTGIINRLRLDLKTDSPGDGSEFEVDYFRMIRMEPAQATGTTT